MVMSNDVSKRRAPSRRWLSGLTVAVALAVALPAAAGDIKYYKDGQVPTPEEINKLLNPEKKVRTRAIVFGADGKQQAEPEQSAGAFALPIRFGFNSAEIEPDARAYLDSVGKVLAMESNSAMKIVVEGHTDASGSDSYNMDLSVRRAEAVKNYLTGQYAVDPARITAVGKGETEPFNATDPTASENRRVQFRRADG